MTSPCWEQMSSTHFPFDTCDVLLGKGGGGAVYLGRHHETKEYVAIKRCYTRRSNNEEYSLEHSVGAELFSQIHNCNSTPLLAHSFSQPFITSTNNNNNNTCKSKKSKNSINSNNRKIEWNRDFFTRNATREATAMTNECMANNSNSNDLIKRQINCEREEQTVEQEESWEKEEEPELALTLPVHSFARKPNWPFSELSQETESDNELTNKFGPPLLTESISSQKCISPSELNSQQICTQNEEDMREESNLQMQASRHTHCGSYSVNNNINSNDNNNNITITDSYQKAGSLNRTINTFTPLMINTNNTLSKTTSNIYKKKNSKDYDYHHHQSSKEGINTHYRTETKSGWRSLTMSPLLLSNSASSQHYKERTINSLNTEVCILHALPLHPHIVTFYGSYTSSRLVTFFAMELMHSDVSRELHHHNVQMMNEQTCVAIAFSVLEALEHLHRHNIAHRDVKPGNILLKHMSNKERTTTSEELLFSQVKRTEMEELKESIYHPHCNLDKSKKTENMRSNKKADKTKRCKHNEEKLSTKEKYECEEKEKSQEEECELVKACLGDFSAAHFVTNKNASAGSPAFDYNINNDNNKGLERWYNKFPEEHEPSSHHERVKLNVRGSLHYKSPEQLLGKAINNYTACDMWALGCTLFEMCTGAIAFGGDSEMSVQLEIFCQLKSSFQEYPNQDDTLAPLYHRFTLSELFVDLLQHLLVIDPCKRWSATEALAHPIFDTLRATQRAKESMLQNTSRENESCELSKETATNSSFCSAADSESVVFPLHLKYARDVNKYEHMWRFRPIATTPPSSPLTFSQQPLTLRSRHAQSISEQQINLLEEEEEQENNENQNQQVQRHEEEQNSKQYMTAQDHPPQQWEPEEEQSEMSMSRMNTVRSITTNQLSHVELHNKSHVLMPSKVLSLTDDAEMNNSIYSTNNNNDSDDSDDNKETSEQTECLSEEREDENQMSVEEHDMNAMHSNNECLEPNMSSFLSDAQSQHWSRIHSFLNDSVHLNSSRLTANNVEHCTHTEKEHVVQETEPCTEKDNHKTHITQNEEYREHSLENDKMIYSHAHVDNNIRNNNNCCSNNSPWLRSHLELSPSPMWTSSTQNRLNRISYGLTCYRDRSTSSRMTVTRALNLNDMSVHKSLWQSEEKKHENAHNPMIEDEHHHENNYNNIKNINSSNTSGQAILNDTTNEYFNKNREMQIIKINENQGREQKTQSNSDCNLSTRNNKDEAQQHEQHEQRKVKKQQQEQEEEEEEVNVIALPSMRASKALFFESPSLECKRTRPDDNYITTNNNNNTAIATMTSETTVLFGKEMMNSSVPHSLAALALFHDSAQGLPDEEFYMTSHSCRSTPSVTPVCFRNELPMPQASEFTHVEKVVHSFIPPCEDVKIREESSNLNNVDNSDNINNANNKSFTVTVQKEDTPVQQVHEKISKGNSSSNYHKVRKSNKLFVRKTKSTSSSLSESSTSCESTTPLILPTLPPPPLPIPLSLATSTSFTANNMMNNTNTLSFPSMCTQHYKNNNNNNNNTREPLRDISNSATHLLESDNNNNKTHMITPITNRLRRSESREKWNHRAIFTHSHSVLHSVRGDNMQHIQRLSGVKTRRDAASEANCGKVHKLYRCYGVERHCTPSIDQVSVTDETANINDNNDHDKMSLVNDDYRHAQSEPEKYLLSASKRTRLE